MAILRFTGKIKIIGVNPYLLVSATRAKQIKAGWRKPMPVLMRINGTPKTPWKINMMPTGKGSFYLYLHGEVRKASKTKVGDTIEAEVWFDSSYRNGPQHPIPAQLKKAFKEQPIVKKNWDVLTPSRQKEVLRYLSHLKSPEALERNIAKVITVLSGPEERFMGRTWKDGK